MVLMVAYRKEVLYIQKVFNSISHLQWICFLLGNFGNKHKFCFMLGNECFEKAFSIKKCSLRTEILQTN